MCCAMQHAVGEKIYSTKLLLDVGELELGLVEAIVALRIETAVHVRT